MKSILGSDGSINKNIARDVDLVKSASDREHIGTVFDRVWDKIKDWFNTTHIQESKKCLFDLYSPSSTDEKKLGSYFRLKELAGHAYKDRFIEQAVGDNLTFKINFGDALPDYEFVMVANGEAELAVSSSRQSRRGSLGETDSDFDSFDSLSIASSLDEAEFQNIDTDLMSNITDHPDFDDGLGFKVSKDVYRGYSLDKNNEIYSYIAKNSNPNWFSGAVGRAIRYVSTGAFNLNCIVCAKAVERNLEAIVLGQVDRFWFAKSTDTGVLYQNVSDQNYAAHSIADGSLSAFIADKVTAHSRNIITVPVRGVAYSHAMNLLHNGADIIVIDGQFGVVYNMSSPESARSFDQKYGFGQGNNMFQIYRTGAAPEI